MTKQIPLRLPDALATEVDAFAAKEKLSRNAAIERLLRAGLDASAAAAAPKRQPRGGSSIVPPTHKVEVISPPGKVISRAPRLAGFDAATGKPIYR